MMEISRLTANLRVCVWGGGVEVGFHIFWVCGLRVNLQIHHCELAFLRYQEKFPLLALTALHLLL